MTKQYSRGMRGTSRRRSVVFFSLAVALLFLFAGLTSARGQTSQTLSGTVTDPSGAAIAQATVSVYARDGGFRRSTSTNEQGEYQLGAIAPGEYVVEVVGPDSFRSVTESVS